MKPIAAIKINVITLLLLVMNATLLRADTRVSKDSVFNADSVLKIMKRVGDWQLQSWKMDGFKHKKTDWTNAALYTGLFDLGKVTNDEKYQQALIAIGNDVGWNTGPNHLLADDYCVGQTYSLLYMKYKQPEMIAPFKHQADSIVTLPFSESLEWKIIYKSANGPGAMPCLWGQRHWLIYLPLPAIKNTWTKRYCYGGKPLIIYMMRTNTSIRAMAVSLIKKKRMAPRCFGRGVMAGYWPVWPACSKTCRLIIPAGKNSRSSLKLWRQK